MNIEHIIDKQTNAVYLNRTLLGDKWGVETADRQSFFTFYGRKRNVQIFSDFLEEGESGIIRTVHAAMSEGEWRLEYKATKNNSEIRIDQVLTALKYSLFQDFVCRFRVQKQMFPIALIAGKKIKHDQRNIWHQYKTDSVQLIGSDKRIQVNYLDAHILKDRFSKEIYVRDEPGDYWVVHLRLMPNEIEKYWVQWDTRFGRVLSLGDHISRILLKSGWFKNTFWYRAERIGGSPNIQAQGLSCLHKNEHLKISAEFKIMRDEGN